MKTQKEPQSQTQWWAEPKSTCRQGQERTVWKQLLTIPKNSLAFLLFGKAPPDAPGTFWKERKKRLKTHQVRQHKIYTNPSYQATVLDEQECKCSLLSSDTGTAQCPAPKGVREPPPESFTLGLLAIDQRVSHSHHGWQLFCHRGRDTQHPSNLSPLDSQQYFLMTKLN